MRLKIIIIIMLLSVITGCSKSGDDSGKTRIRYSVWGGATEKVIWKKMIDQFEARHTNIKVKLEIIPGSYSEKIQTMVAGNSAPDVFYLAHTSEFINYADKGNLLDLTGYINEDKKFNVSDFFPQAIDMLKHKGRIYGVPNSVSVFCLYYNKDLFDLEGIPYPDKNWGWNKLKDTCIKLTKKQNGIKNQFGISFNIHNFFPIMVFQNGGEIFDIKNRKCVINSAKSREALQFTADLINKYNCTPTLAQQESIGHRDQTESLFVNGKTAMYIGGVWLRASFRNIKTFQWDVAPLFKGKKRGNLLVGSGPVIYAKTKHPKESYEFLKFIVGKEGQERYAGLGISMPTRKSVAFSPAFISPEFPPENVKVFIDELKYGNYLGVERITQGEEVRDKIYTELDLVWMNQATVDEACETIVKKVDKVLNPA